MAGKGFSGPMGERFNGKDGELTIKGTVILTKDMDCSKVTITKGAKIITNGYIFSYQEMVHEDGSDVCMSEIIIL